MATAFIYLLPVLTGNYTGQSAVIDAAAIDSSLAWQAVDDPVGNPDSEVVDPTTHSYVQLTGVADQRWSFKFQKPSLAGATNIGSITNVILRSFTRRAAPGTGATIFHFLFFDGQTNKIDSVGLTTTYTHYARDLTTNPITGLPWDIRNFESQAIEFGVGRQNPTGGNSSARTSQIYLEIVYNVAAWSAQPPAGGSWSASATSGGGWFQLPAASGGWTPE